MLLMGCWKVKWGTGGRIRQGGRGGFGGGGNSMLDVFSISSFCRFAI